MNIIRCIVAGLAGFILTYVALSVWGVGDDLRYTASWVVGQVWACTLPYARPLGEKQ